MEANRQCNPPPRALDGGDSSFLMNNILQDLPTEFTTERLHLRCYRSSDISMYYHMLQDNAEHLYEFLLPFLINVHSESDIKAWLDKQSKEQSQPPARQRVM